MPLSLLSVLVLFSAVAHGKEYSEKKIRRIIQVSAAYFDLNPWGEPVEPSLRVDLKSPFSFLPAIREKEFSQDMPLLHALPVMSVGHPLLGGETWSWTASSWFGALVPGLERLAGVRAAPRQWLLGGASQVESRTPDGKVWAELGMQTARTRVTGVENPLPSDIETQSTLQFVSLGFQHREWGLWSSVVLGTKDTAVSVVAADALSLREHDRLSDAPWPLWFVGSLGWDVRSWRFAVSEVCLPKRLLMPRVLMAYRIL